MSKSKIKSELLVSHLL